MAGVCLALPADIVMCSKSRHLDNLLYCGADTAPEASLKALQGPFRNALQQVQTNNRPLILAAAVYNPTALVEYALRCTKAL